MEGRADRLSRREHPCSPSRLRVLRGLSRLLGGCASRWHFRRRSPTAGQGGGRAGAGPRMRALGNRGSFPRLLPCPAAGLTLLLTLTGHSSQDTDSDRSRPGFGKASPLAHPWLQSTLKTHLWVVALGLGVGG